MKNVSNNFEKIKEEVFSEYKSLIDAGMVYTNASMYLSRKQLETISSQSKESKVLMSKNLPDDIKRLLQNCNISSKIENKTKRKKILKKSDFSSSTTEIEAIKHNCKKPLVKAINTKNIKNDEMELDKINKEIKMIIKNNGPRKKIEELRAKRRHILEETTKEDNEAESCSSDIYTHSPCMETTNKQKKNLLPFQKEIIEAAKNHDKLVLYGGRKDIFYDCYEYLGINEDGVTIIVTPNEHVARNKRFALEEKKAIAYFFNSATPLRVLRSGNYEKTKFIFMSPSFISNEAAIKIITDNIYNKGLLRRIVIDDADSVFLPGDDYSHATVLTTLFDKSQIILMTRTVSKSVLEQTKAIFFMQSAITIKDNPCNDNTYYGVIEYAINLKENIIKWIKKKNLLHARGIIICNNETEIMEMKLFLCEHGLKTSILTEDQNEKDYEYNVNEWMKEKQITLLTTEFYYIPINDNIRYILFTSEPASFSQYVSLSCAVGNDDDLSYSIIFTKQGNKLNTRDELMRKYVTNRTKCMKKIISDYTETNYSGCSKMCDICKH